MSPAKRHAKTHAKARHRRHLQAQARLARDYRQAQQAAQALQQALDALGLPEDLVTEIEGRLRSQKKLLGKIVGVMFPPLFGCRTNAELCRVRGWDKNLVRRESSKEECQQTPGIQVPGEPLRRSSNNHWSAVSSMPLKGPMRGRQALKTWWLG
jgi:hypothetical protein